MNELAVQQGAAMVPAQPTVMDMIQTALQGGAAADVIKSFVELQQSAERFAWEREERQSRMDFDDALNRVQAAISAIPATRTGDKGKYANYGDLDRVVRPLYVAEGFSLSFGEADCPTPGKTRFVAYLRRSGITREYFKDMTASTKGPKGNDVLTPIHAEASADSYAKRYLLKDIFNIAIGDDDNDASGDLPKWLIEHVDAIASADDKDSLNASYAAAYKSALKVGDRKAMGELIFRRDNRLAFLNQRGAQ